MNTKNTKNGYSLVEVLVSISVLLIATVGPMAIATQGIKSSQFALEQNTASFLAQEGIEAMFAIRNGYALEDIDNGLDPTDDISWDWVVAPSNNGASIMRSNSGPCHPGNKLNNDSTENTCSVGVQFSGGGYNGVSLLNCNDDVSNCDLLLDESNNRAVYNHTSGVPTPFRRVVTVTRESDFSIKVESKVTWQSNVFSTEQSVSEITYLFDSNFES